MALNACKVTACKNQKPQRYVLCGNCWSKLSANVQMAIREGTEKGNHTLRAVPSRQWFERAIQSLGMIKIPYIVGAGVHAVKIANDRSEV